jgi:hypothetical protein
VTDEELAQAWAELHAVNELLGWRLGLPAFFERTSHWELYAFDPTERPKVGRRSREWTASAPTEARVVREMARCLGEIRRTGTAPR